MASRLQDVILRGTRAAQPLATTVAPGTLYFVTDELLTEQSDGTTWNTYADGGAFSALRVSAGTLSQNLTNLVFSNSNGVSFGLSASTITVSVAPSGGLTNVNISAGTTSQNLSNFIFSNSNNVSFGLDGSTITAIATVASTQGNINISAGTTSNLSSNFIFSNSNNVSFGLNNNTVTATVTIASSLTNVNISAGTTSNNLSVLVFSNSNGVTFGLDGSTITASAVGGAGGGATLSYYENMPLVPDTATIGMSSLMMVHPFVLNQNLSGSFLRHPVSFTLSNQTFGATSAVTTWTVSKVNTFGINIFTRGTGASSNSLFSQFTTSIGSTHATVVQAGAVGSNYTVTYSFVYPLSGSTSSFSTSYACTSASYVVNNAGVSASFGSIKWLDYPFDNSFTPGNYWVGIALSSTTSNNAGPGAAGNGQNYSFLLLSQVNFRPGIIGFSAGANDLFQLGAGSLSTNSQFFNTTGFDITQLTTIGSNRAVFFQAIKP